MSELERPPCGLCDRCEKRPGEVGPCEFDVEIYGESNAEECSCCEQCRYECYLDT